MQLIHGSIFQKQINSGLTLVEFMVTIAVVAILASVMLPNYSTFLNNMRLDNQISELHRMLLATRNIAINSGENATLCPINEANRCVSDWQLSLIVFIDKNNNGIYEANNEVILKYKNGVPDGDKLIYGKHRDKIVYQPTGNLGGLNNGTFRYCTKLAPDKAKGIVVARSGRIYMTSDINGDGYDQNRSYKRISCT